MRVVSRTMCGDPLLNCHLADVYEPNTIAAQRHYRWTIPRPNFEIHFRAENLTLGDAVVPANLQDLAFFILRIGAHWERQPQVTLAPLWVS